MRSRSKSLNAVSEASEVRLRAHREFSGISLSERSYPAGFEMPRHTHAEAYVTVALDGSYREQAAGTSRLCRERTVVFRPAGEPHASRFHEHGGRCLRVAFADAWVARLTEAMRLPERSIDTSDRRATWLGAQLREELRSDDAVAPVAVEGLALALLADVARAPRFARTRDDPPWLRSVLERIRAEYRTSLTLADLAVSAGVHPVHLARVFRERQGTTVAALVRRLRFEWSLRELRASNRPLAEVALEAGYADQSHFSRAFRNATGLTPKAYREGRSTG